MLHHLYIHFLIKKIESGVHTNKEFKFRRRLQHPLQFFPAHMPCESCFLNICMSQCISNFRQWVPVILFYKHMPLVNTFLCAMPPKSHLTSVIYYLVNQADICLRLVLISIQVTDEAFFQTGGLLSIVAQADTVLCILWGWPIPIHILIIQCL